jgi:2-polyprenyl-6-hydroxyphenyl methylase / 3-demethylubiquinone-9 3-methyltransferase
MSRAETPHDHPAASPAHFDALAGDWWRPGSPLSMLYWLARARARLIPPADRPGAVLVDLGCGGGLLAPHVAGKGYRHIGVDIISSGLEQARMHGVTAVQADVTRLPLATGCADVVSAGELLEHVADVPGVVAEACRILRPGGWLVLDTINRTGLADVLAVRVAELVMPAVRGLHDANLFVDPATLTAECAKHGVALEVRGIRPTLPSLARWVVTRRNAVPIVSTRFMGVLYQARGKKT